MSNVLITEHISCLSNKLKQYAELIVKSSLYAASLTADTCDHITVGDVQSPAAVLQVFVERGQG